MSPRVWICNFDGPLLSTFPHGSKMEKELIYWPVGEMQHGKTSCSANKNKTSCQLQFQPWSEHISIDVLWPILPCVGPGCKGSSLGFCIDSGLTRLGNWYTGMSLAKQNRHEEVFPGHIQNRQGTNVKLKKMQIKQECQTLPTCFPVEIVTILGRSRRQKGREKVKCGDRGVERRE